MAGADLRLTSKNMNEPLGTHGRNSSVLGRLLEELSWVGSTIRDYRNGGRGYENVLTAEALQGLDFLPRDAFFGAIIAGARGADDARKKLISEIEEAHFTLLPGSHYLIPSGGRHQTKLPVQPDGVIESPSTYVVLEAKRIRSSSFQSEQLAREYVLALRDSGARSPLLFLLLGSEPPVKVEKHGRLPISDAISLYLESVLTRAEHHSITAEDALARVSQVVCWITWHEIAAIVEVQQSAVVFGGSSVNAAIARLAGSVTRAIAWHGR